MRNLRKLTAVVLAVALVLTSMAAAFAATESTTAATATVVNGDKAAVLKELKLYAGTDDTNPAAGLESALKVQDALIWLATEFGYKAEADKLTDEDATKALAKFADAKDVSDYAKKVVAYSAQEGIIAGEKDKAGKLYVKPAASVTAARFATFIVKGLGYDLTGSFTEAVAQLSEVEGAKIDAEATGDLTRDAAVGFMYGVLTAKTDSGKTVAENLLAADSSLQTVLSKNSLLPVNGTLALDTVVASANNKVTVTLKEAAAATAADFAIVKKGTTTAVAVKDVVKESDKVFTLETEALSGGASYTLTANGVSINFTGLAADTTAPEVKKVTGADTNKFEIQYSDRMDFATATDVANYTFTSNTIKAVSATLDSDRTKVTLITEGAKKNVAYTMTIQNVKNSDGKAVSKTTRTVTANEDKIAPQVAALSRQNNRMVVVEFRDEHGMNKEALETVANYSINDLTIKSAKAYDTDGDGKYIKVVLTTDTQESNKAYTLTMENLTDNAVLKNPLGKATRSFRGCPADVSAPTVNTAKTITSYNNNEVEIFFNDSNAMDVASIEDVSNYEIKDDKGNVLEIISAKAMATEYPDAYKEGSRGVTLTTAQQIVYPSKINYTVRVLGVQDEFGNALKAISGTTYQQYKFISSPIDTQAPFVKKVENVDLTTVKLTFNEPLKKELAQDPTNYVIDEGLGSAIKAKYDDKVVTLTTQTMTGNKKYTVTMNNIEDKYTNRVADAKAVFVATSDALDVTAPSISQVYAMNRSEVYVSLSEALKDNDTVPGSIEIAAVDSNGKFVGATAKTVAYKGLIEGKTTAVYSIGTTNTLLSAGYSNYQIMSVTTGNFTDAAGNKMKFTNKVNGDEADGYTFGISDVANERPAIDYVEQIDGKTLKVTFNEPVKPTSTSTTNGYSVIDDNGDTYYTSWYWNNSTAFTGASVKLLQNIVFDLSGAGNTEYTFDQTYKDTEKPVISGAFADNNTTIYVQYNESLSTPGTYKVYYKNDAGTSFNVFTGIGEVKDDPNGNKAVKLSLTYPNALNSSYIYYLEAVQPAKDKAGNPAEVGGVKAEFPGTDKAVDTFIAGVAIINATEIKITSTEKKIASVQTVVSESGDNLISTPAVISTPDFSVTVALELPVLSGVKYTANVTYVGGGTGTYSFPGNTPDLGITLTQVGADVVLGFQGFNVEEYSKFEIVEVTNGAIVLPVMTGTIAGKGTDTLLDDSVKFLGYTAVTTSQYYVFVYAKDDNTTVVYAAKVEVQ